MRAELIKTWNLQEESAVNLKEVESFEIRVGEMFEDPKVGRSFHLLLPEQNHLITSKVLDIKLRDGSWTFTTMNSRYLLKPLETNGDNSRPN